MLSTVASLCYICLVELLPSMQDLIGSTLVANEVSMGCCRPTLHAQFKLAGFEPDSIMPL